MTSWIWASTTDDLEQEMLIREDGARDAKEAAQSPDGAAGLGSEPG